MDKKKYIDIISAQADKNHRPHELALNDFLDYLLEFFSVKAFQSGPDTYHQRLLDCTQKCPEFAGLATLWLTDVATAMEQGKWLDVFGILYEELYLTRGKASHTGQFFTPPSVADIMSRISSLNEKQSGIVNDCASGSGRLLLAHYMEKSSLDHSAGRRFRYIAQDVDPIACKMCALNLMAHGMNANVICQDTLAMSTPSVIYCVNEVKYPFNTPFYSVRVVRPVRM